MMEETQRKVRRSGGVLGLCKCPECGAWHVKGKKCKEG